MIELRILGGARAGERVRTDDATVLIGRHPSAQLRLDPERDLDVSSRHAELRQRDGEWLIADLGSTNGTFMHGVKVEGEWIVQDGDVIQLGANGPQVELVLSSRADAEGPATELSSRAEDLSSRANARDLPSLGSGQAASPEPPRRSTQERIAIAVHSETAKLRKALVALGFLVIAGIGTAYWVGHRESQAQLDQLRALVADDASSSLLRARLAGLGDSAILAALGRVDESLKVRVSSATPEQAEALRAEIERHNAAQRQLASVDFRDINARNAPATAILVAELGGKPFAGTAFAITPAGLLVTNRHLVEMNGAKATRLAVKFRDRRDWLAAHTVKVATGADDDLALIQLDDPAQVPVIAGIAANGGDMREGAPVVTIGYPLGMDTRMEGTGDDFAAKSTLFPGTVSKRVSSLIQVAAWAGHGSSGSPVLGANGLVMGVVWGGPKDSNGQLVYAVPGDRLAAFVKAEAPGIVR